MSTLVRDWQQEVYHPKIDWTISVEEWQELSGECFARDQYTCQRCGDKTTQLSPHHIIPRADGGGDYIENLVTLCITCHNFVELQGYRTLAEITCQDNDPVIELELKKSNFVDTFDRPEWHKYVYGGRRRPRN